MAFSLVGAVLSVSFDRKDICSVENLLQHIPEVFLWKPDPTCSNSGKERWLTKTACLTTAEGRCCAPCQLYDASTLVTGKRKQVNC